MKYIITAFFISCEITQNGFNSIKKVCTCQAIHAVVCSVNFFTPKGDQENSYQRLLAEVCDAQAIDVYVLLSNKILSISLLCNFCAFRQPQCNVNSVVLFN